MIKTPGLIYIIICSGLLFSGCDPLPIRDDLTGSSYHVVDQDSTVYKFPIDFVGKVTVLSYIYTHCPDVCPLITTNMKTIARKLESTDQVQFIGISFDPARDTPAVLKNYAQNYRLRAPSWHLLTGNETEINLLLQRLEVEARQSYTSFSDNGSLRYFMTHTDRITLIDSEGRIRKHYIGSEVNTEEVVSDIGRLLTKTKS